MKVVIIDYGAGNIFSVKQAFQRLGVEAVLTSDEREIRSASHVIFPGVGHAKSAMEQLKQTGLDKVIPTLTQPVLGICLGMQLMCKKTEEGEVEGLGIFNAVVKHFETQPSVGEKFQIPHMGWNDVSYDNRTEAFYFVHSYAADISEHTWGVAAYPNSFSASLRNRNFWGVQFHPEKSGVAGEILIKEFLTL